MTISKSAARAMVDLAEGVVVATVEIEAPPERVFRALTDPAEVVAWWGSPETYRTEEWTADVRVGGVWRARGRSADGQPYTVEGEFLEVDPPRKLVQTWRYDWDGGGPPTTVTYRLEPLAGGTRVTVHHAGFGDRRDACQSHGQGWEMVLGWLGAHVTRRHFFLCRLHPPRPSFAETLSPAELELMRAHGAYWRSQCQSGAVIVFGPVADQSGTWGVIILRARERSEIEALQNEDPVIRAGVGFRYDTLPMPQAVVASELVGGA